MLLHISHTARWADIRLTYPADQYFVLSSAPDKAEPYHNLGQSHKSPGDWNRVASSKTDRLSAQPRVTNTTVIISIRKEEGERKERSRMTNLMSAKH